MLMKGLDVLGWGLRLPTAVGSAEDLWQALLDDEAAITPPPAGFKVRNHAGFLAPQFTPEEAKQVARANGIDAAEANVNLENSYVVDPLVPDVEHAVRNAVHLLERLSDLLSKFEVGSGSNIFERLFF